ncbi:hypothetical protein [Brumimicrobium oceani]|uniref:Lipoprotein n=1 Tax=Brumimicrobium oceani TaxID=2100725 RepID=A0A2U2XGJ9_9FLAO|nr:hypothetical protein [Brumimicrobium oceani]PWH86877.1 hypothetical protein DIT68_01050 [Brumimicrobium oceani]
MKGRILLIFISLAFFACKKIPERAHFDIELISINNDTALVNQGIELDYDEIHVFKYYFKSDVPLDSIYVQLIKHPSERVTKFEEERISPKLNQESESGFFVYTLNPLEQCEPPVTGPLSKFEFIKVVFINRLGVVSEHLVQFKII